MPTTRSTKGNTTTEETTTTHSRGTSPVATPHPSPPAAVTVEPDSDTTALRVSGLELALGTLRQDIGSVLNRLEGLSIPNVIPVTTNSSVTAALGHTPVNSVPEFDDSKIGWDEFKAVFESIALINGWDARQKAAKLLGSLRGKAMRVVTHISAEHRCNYDHIISALNDSYTSPDSQQLFIAQLNQRVQSATEDIRSYWEDVQWLGHRAYGNLSTDTQNVLFTKHFCEGLRDSRLREHLFLSSPTDMRGCLRLSLAFEAAHARATGGRGSDSSRTYDNPRTTRPRPTYSRDRRDGSGTQRFRPPTCWSCGTVGHVQARCPRSTGNENQPR